MSVLRPASLAAAAALALAACGSDDDGADGPAFLVPAGAPIYAEATVDRESEELADAGALIDRLGSLPLLGSPLDGGDLVDLAFEELEAESGVELSYAEDVEPWLGDRVALGVGSFDEAADDGVFVVETTDEALARDTLERLAGDTAEELEHEGVEYLFDSEDEMAAGIVDGFVVLTGTAEHFEAVVDASGGASLGETDEFADAFAGLEAESLGRLYVHLGEVPDEAFVDDPGDSLEDIQAARTALPELFAQPLAATISAEPDGLVADLAIRAGEDVAPAESDLLGAAPADAIVALGIDDPAAIVAEAVGRIEEVGAALGEAGLTEGSVAAAFEAQFGLTLDDALAEFGDAVAYWSGEAGDAGVFGLEIALNEGAGDPATSAPLQLLTQLGDLLEAEPGFRLGSPLNERGTGFSAVMSTADSGPVALLDAEIEADRLSLDYAIPPSAADDRVTDELGSDALFGEATAALGEDFAPLAVSNPQPIVELVLENASYADAVSGPEAAALGFVADKLSYAVAGTRSDGERLITRIRIGVD